MTKKHTSKVILVLLFVLAVVLFHVYGLSEYFTLEWIKSKQADFALYREANPLLTAALFFGVYVTVVAFSVPGATVMTLLAGALFEFGEGLILISFASTIGATFAFWVSRWVLYDWVQESFGEKVRPINEGFEREGGFYLFSLRLIPLFPFFLVNLAMGLTPIKSWKYFWISQIGMLPGTAVFVFAGTELAKLDSLAGILNFKLILAFSLIGLLPITSKKLLELFKRSHEAGKTQKV